jgi:energy-coupling factor transporter ATP-binding protein EcfA2
MDYASTNHQPLPIPEVPSRQSNPFATCWTKPGALAFRFPAGQNAEQLVARLAAQNSRGEIVGQHGSGKSTLLAALIPLFKGTGRQVTLIALRNRQRRLPKQTLRDALATMRPLLIIDGYEQLSYISRARLRWRCRRSGTGLLVTSHVATGLPPLIHLRPDLPLVEQLVADLTQLRPSAISSADISASHACHGSNVRDLFFDLYDRHEVARGATRTATASVA